MNSSKDESKALKGTVLPEISCFHDYGQELALSLLYYLETPSKR